jgi:hypothetical protein
MSSKDVIMTGSLLVYHNKAATKADCRTAKYRPDEKMTDHNTWWLTFS